MLEFQYPVMFLHTRRVGRITQQELISSDAIFSHEIPTENSIKDP